MPSPAKINYVNGVVICHGKSEVCLSTFICTNLHLNVKTDAKNKGKNSIQITSLNDWLSSPPYKNMKSLLDKYEIETKGKGKNKKLINFKIFAIMDTDDCTEQQKKDFISGKMFSGHWLSEYIVPIYNVNNLESVLKDSGIMSKKIKNDEKGSYYEKVFPINKKPLSDDTLSEVKTFLSKVKSVKNTNIEVFVEYCIELIGK
ncbi:MAG: hypothetical protein J6V36_00220 [Clostridia bacterium]|nr:hypothetical protein [Clostridia bacterium]